MLEGRVVHVAKPLHTWSSLWILSVVMTISLGFILRRRVRLLKSCSMYGRWHSWIPPIVVLTIFLVLLCFLITRLTLVLCVFSSVRGPSMASNTNKVTAIIATCLSQQAWLRFLIYEASLILINCALFSTFLRTFFFHRWIIQPFLTCGCEVTPSWLGIKAIKLKVSLWCSGYWRPVLILYPKWHSLVRYRLWVGALLNRWGVHKVVECL